MIGSAYFALALLLSSTTNGLDLDVVNSAIGALARGADPYEIEGVAPRSDTEEFNLPDLAGCEPILGNASSRSFVLVDFHCQYENGIHSHRAFFNLADDGRVKLNIDPLLTMRGPTKAALEAKKLPQMQVQLNRFAKAVRRSEDPTLNGLIPLNADQFEVLQSLSDCDWDQPRESRREENTWISFVQCAHHGGDRLRMVSAEFDRDRRVIAILIGHGSIVRRPF